VIEKQCVQILDYYNGHLSEIERNRFKQHLEKCSECQEELLQLHALEDYLPYASEPVDPPSGLEEKVFASILIEDGGQEEGHQYTGGRRNRWRFPAVAALLALSLIGNVYFYNQLSEEPEVAEKEQVDQIVEYVDLTRVEGKAKGTASIVKQGDATRLIVQASALENLNNEEVYQVWLIKDEKPKRAGTFTVEDGKGSVVFNFKENYENVDWDMVAVSHEPNANSKLPRGSIVLASEL
jgi:anti-sigma-K factor RskA